MTKENAEIPPVVRRLAADFLMELFSAMADRTCDDYRWPTWVPMEVRAEIIKASDLENRGVRNSADVESAVTEYGAAGCEVAMGLARLVRGGS